MRILAISGSLQATSANLSLLQRAAELLPPGAELSLFDGIRDLPHFNPELEADGELAVVETWRRALRESDALLIASPEYGHSLPGVLKNAIDWVIGTGELEGKIVALTASTPGAERGRRGLEAVKVTLGAVRGRIVGGEPIVRGPNADAELRQLLASLSETVRESEALALPPNPRN
jgi:NAD(P)H-dependent FMN reductase